MRVDRHYTRETLKRLVRINSVNPTLAPGAPGEREIARFVGESLRRTGLATEILEPAPGRMTALGRLTGSGGGPSLMLNAHCDTVDTGGMAEPFSGAIRDGKLYGRGSYDMKGSLAACMAGWHGSNLVITLRGLLGLDVAQWANVLRTADSVAAFHCDSRIPQFLAVF